MLANDGKDAVNYFLLSSYQVSFIKYLGKIFHFRSSSASGNRSSGDDLQSMLDGFVCRGQSEGHLGQFALAFVANEKIFFSRN